MFAISLSSCSRYNANFKLDQSQLSLFMTVRHIFEISEDDHPCTVSHAHDHWWTLDFANAFVSPGVNSRGELVPSHDASRRRLGNLNFILKCQFMRCSMSKLFQSWFRFPAMFKFQSPNSSLPSQLTQLTHSQLKVCRWWSNSEMLTT
jgi:hypothetical protein